MGAWVDCLSIAPARLYCGRPHPSHSWLCCYSSGPSIAILTTWGGRLQNSYHDTIFSVNNPCLAVTRTYVCFLLLGASDQLKFFSFCHAQVGVNRTRLCSIVVDWHVPRLAAVQ